MSKTTTIKAVSVVGNEQSSVAEATYTLPSTDAEIKPDSHTFLLDHFDGATVGLAFGNLHFVPSIKGLGAAADLMPGTYVRYQLDPSLEKQATVEFLVKPAQFGTGLMDWNWNAVTTPPPAGHVLHVRLNQDGTVGIGGWAWNPAFMYALNSTAPLSLNKFNHVAVSWSPAGSKIYIDGVLSAHNAQCFAPAAPRWGYLNYWGGYSLGSVDEFEISTIQRSDAEVASHAAQVLGQK